MTLKRGDIIVDNDGYKGVVVKIIPGISDEKHGTIYVWQMDRTEYGADNCEHYVEFGWKNNLRIINDSK
jgi:signal peptidase I